MTTDSRKHIVGPTERREEIARTFHHHGRHPWLQAGDRPERVWILKFDDTDQRDMLWSGEDAEEQALAAYALYSPTWNCTLLATVKADAILASDGEGVTSRLPEGWVTVPREATRTMLRAGSEADHLWIYGPDIPFDEDPRDAFEDISLIYAALLAAAPPLPEPTQDGSDGGRERASVSECWQDLLDKDDRTSPVDYPEMCLITREELADYMASDGGREMVRALIEACEPLAIVPRTLTIENLDRLSEAHAKAKEWLEGKG